MVLKNLENLEVSKWAGIAYRWAGIVDWTVLFIVIRMTSFPNHAIIQIVPNVDWPKKLLQKDN